MDSSRKKRIIFDLGLVFSALFLPWWFTTILVVLGIFIFESFLEAFFVALFVDSFYGVSREFFYNLGYVYFGLVLIVYFFAGWVKGMLRM